MYSVVNYIEFDRYKLKVFFFFFHDEMNNELKTLYFIEDIIFFYELKTYEDIFLYEEMNNE